MRSTTQRLQDESGATIVLVAISLVALIGFAALAIDLGMLFAVRGEAQRAADAAALAGASVYIEEAMPVGGADARARSYAGRNTLLGTLIDADPESGYVSVEDNPAAERVRVTVRTAVPTWFARIFGRNTVDIGAVAAARVFNTGSVACIKPFGVPDGAYDENRIGDDVLLWESRSNQAEEDGEGAFLLVGNDESNSGVGRDIYEMLTTTECPETTVRTGSEIPAKPGNNSLGNVKKALNDITAEYGDLSWSPDGPYDGFSREDYLNDPRVALVPTYAPDSYAGSGTDDIRVTGFVTVFVQSELRSCFANKEPYCQFDGNGKREQLYAILLPAIGITDNCVGEGCANLTRVLQLVD